LVSQVTIYHQQTYFHLDYILDIKFIQNDLLNSVGQ